MTEDARFLDLRGAISQVLADALAAEDRHQADLQRRDEIHVAETSRRDALHVDEMQRRDDLHAHEMILIREALETRDLIGQAKGILIAAMACSSDEAFHLLRAQSSHENRKLVEVAAEIVARASAGRAFERAAERDRVV
jgi:hypothetical protein